MPNQRIQPPWEFLLSASRHSLQSYELSRLSHASNLRKEIAALLDLWIEENSSAMLARWLLEHQDREAEAAAESRPQAARTVSDNFLSDRLVMPLPAHGNPRL